MSRSRKVQVDDRSAHRIIVPIPIPIAIASAYRFGGCRERPSSHERVPPARDDVGMSEMRDDAPLRYYDGDGADPLPVVLEALRESGRDAEQVEIDDLAGIDEFHALGRPATMALADLAGVERGAAVIDVGAGLGGPTRFLARLGARVTAVEPTDRFRRACAELNRR